MTAILSQFPDTWAGLEEAGITGLCCLELDNLDILQALYGVREYEACLNRVEAMLKCIFQPEMVGKNAKGTGFYIWLTQADPGASLNAVFDQIVQEPLVILRAGHAAFERGLGKAELLSHSQIAALVAKISKGTWLTYGAQTHLHERGLHGWAGLLGSMQQNNIAIMAQEIRPLVNYNVAGPRQFEILVRIMDSQGNIYPIDAVLLHAEGSYHIETLDRWVLHAVLMGHRDELASHPSLHLSLNVSGRSISRADFASFMTDLIAKAGIAADRLQLEITETAEISDLANARQNVGALQALGVKLALDDYGSGFSGPFYLTALAVDVIKVDGALISQLSDRAAAKRAETILCAILGMAKALGAETVAEYASDEKLMGILARIGFDKAQGYAIGHPLPLAEVFSQLPKV